MTSVKEKRVSRDEGYRALASALTWRGTLHAGKGLGAGSNKPPFAAAGASSRPNP